jgi:hypothetical protein
MSFLWVSSLVLEFGRDDQSLGKPGLIVHIKEMADKTDNTSSATPVYRERVPDHAPTRAPIPAPKPAQNAADALPETKPENPEKKPELGGPKGPEPTRFGDWERDGRFVDF